jgi:predicted TIM-barrel fold metal-dependent hydrolase
MIIDFHAHTFPDDLAPRAIAALSAKAGVPAFTDGTNAGLCASMRDAGIACAVLMPIATKPGQVRGINAWAAALNREGGALRAFGTLHPAQTDWAEEIARLAADGVPGVKLHPDYQGFYIDDPAHYPLFRALAAAERLVLVHAGIDIGLPPPVHCPPERLARLLDAVPALTVIAAHMGAYGQWEAVERELLGRSLYFDTSYSFAALGAARMLTLIRAHGVARILFGTDSPWRAQAAEVAAISALPLTDTERAAVLGGNAQRLLGRLAPGQETCTGGWK